MSVTTRMLPLNCTGGQITGFAGSPNPADPARRYYTAGPGQTIDAQGPPDGDAAVLVSQSFALVGPWLFQGRHAVRRPDPWRGHYVRRQRLEKCRQRERCVKTHGRKAACLPETPRRQR
jgi:hypothetical protein